MAVGDAYVVSPATVTNGSFMDLQPASTAEAVVHNIYVPEGTAYELYYYDGADTIKFDHDAAVGRNNVQYHVTNAVYVRIKNTSGASAIFAADGMYTHA